MKYIEKIERVGSYIAYKFTSHNGSDYCFGDQIWSNGERVEICEYCDSELLHELISDVENKREFISALVRDGVMG